MVDITVGQQLKRSAIHDMYGGNRQKGIAPSGSWPFILLFSNPVGGRKNGYVDDWGADGYYHYTGEGLIGDQKMEDGNLTLLKHQEDGRPLHLFKSVASGVVAYLGEFTLAAEQPWYRTDTPDRNGETRSAIMFRLRPADVTRYDAEHSRHDSALTVEDVDVEQHHTERTTTKPTQAREAERREAPLVRDYRAYLESQGHAVGRKKITPAGELRSLYTDLHDITDNQLIEGKGTVAREAMRMGIGQLMDYRRYLAPEPSLALLLPLRPAQDLIDLCTSLSIQVIWRDGDAFAKSDV